MKKLLLSTIAVSFLLVFSMGGVMAWWTPNFPDFHMDINFGGDTCSSDAQCGTSTGCTEYKCQYSNGPFMGKTCMVAYSPSGTVSNTDPCLFCNGEGGTTVNPACYSPGTLICIDGDACTTDVFINVPYGVDCQMVNLIPQIYPRQAIICDNGDNLPDSCNPQTGCVFTPNCGNQILEGTEECDDGNLEDGDGCTANCTMEQDVPIVPEFGTMVMMLTALSAIGIFFVVRRK